jgi:serine protease Do
MKSKFAMVKNQQRRCQAALLVLVLVWSWSCCDFSQVLAQTEKQTEIAEPNAEEIAKANERLLQGVLLTPKAVRVASEKIRGSLVTIESFGGVSAVQGRIGGIRRQGEGNTTGIVISHDGFIVTSTFNFAKNPPIISVITSDGKRRLAHVVGRDDTRKICLLKVKDLVGFDQLPLPTFVPLSELQIGQTTISVGVGFGDSTPAISTGIVSAVNRIGGRAVQTDANVSPANYGGPLLDIEGRLLGVCVPLSPTSEEIGAGVEWYDSGIGFAVPLAGLDSIIEKMKAGGNIRPAFMGISVIPSLEPIGVMVQEIVKESPASKTELKKEDVITKVNDQEVFDVMSFQTVVRRYVGGDQVKITIKRKDAEQVIDFTFGDRSADVTEPVATTDESPSPQPPLPELPEK